MPSDTSPPRHPCPQDTQDMLAQAKRLIEERDVQLGQLQALLDEQAAHNRLLQVQLNEHNAQFEVLQRFSSDWYWEQDTQFRFTSVKRMALAETRFPVGGSIGKTRWELPYIDVTEEEWAQHRAVLQAHLPFRDTVFKRRDARGNIGYVCVSGIPVFDADGGFAGYKGVGKDITERRLAEQREAMEHAVARYLAFVHEPASAITDVLQTMCSTLEWDLGAFWGMDPHTGALRRRYVWNNPSVDLAEFINSDQSRIVERAILPPLATQGLKRRAWHSQEPAWIADVQQEPTFRRAPIAAKAGLHSAFAFPIVASGESLGVMEFFGREIRQPDALLMRSARAIGNQIGLFYQRKLSEARQAMEHRVTRLLAGSDGPEQIVPKILETLCESLGWDYGAYWRLNEQTQTVLCEATWSVASLDAGALSTHMRAKVFNVSELKAPRDKPGLLRHLWQTAKPVWIADVKEETNSPRARIAARAGLRAAVFVPVLEGAEVVGAMEFFSHEARQPDGVLIDTVGAIGIQIGQFMRRNEAQERIHALAYYDSLTGLPNRTLFSHHLQHALQKAHDTADILSVLFIDLDRFKNINDALGHEAGDRLLLDVSKRIAGCLRDCDTVARLGGDEFIVLLEGLPDAQHAANAALRILSVLSRPVVLAEGECHVTASIGISVYPEDGTEAMSLMKHADIAMYQAKDQGKNNYHFYSQHIDVHSVERLAMESDLRRALGRQEFVLHYQAKVDLKSGRMTGMEALVRWQHPERGMVPPASFIALAEETGLIVPIGRWVLHEACAQNKAWQEAGFAPLSVAVNLSARQFNDDNLIRDVAQALAQTGLSPAHLELEITESMVMSNPDKAVKVLTQLKAMGISIAMDDFGTGYSSLGQLKRFPINTLKIDRSFINDAVTSSEDAAITEAIIAMGRALHLNVVAEGVETDAQVGFLKERQCDQMQGYYFSKPVPDEQFAQLLRDGKVLERKVTDSEKM